MKTELGLTSVPFAGKVTLKLQGSESEIREFVKVALMTLHELPTFWPLLDSISLELTAQEEW